MVVVAVEASAADGAAAAAVRLVKTMTIAEANMLWTLDVVLVSRGRALTSSRQKCVSGFQHKNRATMSTN